MMTEYIYKPDLEKHVMVRQEEIIRCRDCKFINKHSECIHERSAWYKPNKTWRFPKVKPEEFCAWAERDA